MIVVDYGSISGGGYTDYDVISSFDSTLEYANSHTILNKKGSKVLVLLLDWSSSGITYNVMDNATCSGGTITKLCNINSANAAAGGTFFQVDITSDTCVITSPSQKSGMYMFEAI